MKKSADYREPLQWLSLFASHAKNSTLAATISLVIAMTACQSASEVSAADAASERIIPSRDNTLIVFGGIGYVEENTQSTLYDLLIAERDAASGAYPISDHLDMLVSGKLDVPADFPTLSAYPTALYRSDAESAMKAVSKSDALPHYAIGDLDKYFGRVFGLIFVGDYEDHFQVASTDPTKENGDKSYADYFTTGVSAVLLDLKSKEILLSSSAIGLYKNRVHDTPSLPEEERRLGYLKSYQNAADQAFIRLQKLAAHTNARSLGKSAERHMVTGMWIGTDGARKIFDWDKPDPGESLCTPPNGCQPGSKKCMQLAALLVNGLTSSLSEAGESTLPPLNFSDWRQDSAYEVGVRLHLPQDRESLIGGLRRFTISPKTAQVKHIVALDYVSHETSADSHRMTITDEYFAQLSELRAETYRNSCDVSKPVETIRDDDFIGAISFARHVSLPPPSRESEEAYYKLAIINILPKLSKGEKR